MTTTHDHPGGQRKTPSSTRQRDGQTAGQAARQTSTSTDTPAKHDPWQELEDVIDRLAHLALHAHTLADRAAGPPTAEHPPSETDAARTERVTRLHSAVHLAQAAIAAAIALT